MLLEGEEVLRTVLDFSLDLVGVCFYIVCRACVLEFPVICK